MQCSRVVLYDTVRRVAVCIEQMVTVIALDERAAHYHADQVKLLFGGHVAVDGFSVPAVLGTGAAPADLYCITTDALENLPDFRATLPPDAQIVEIGVTFTREAIEMLELIPAGTRVLFVNLSEKMAAEAITRLNQLGVNHLNYTPFYPGAAPVEGVDVAVTPDEVRYVPEGPQKVINLGQRKMDCNTVVEIALKLKLYDILEESHLKTYLSSIASNSYDFDELFGRSLRLESGFQSLIDILDVGIIGVNEQGVLFVCNKKAEEIVGERLSEQMGRPAVQVVPWIPYEECHRSLRQIDARLIQLKSVPITVHLTPILRNKEYMGAIAMLQCFNEEEARQHKMRIQLLERGHKAKYTFDDIIGTSPAICKVRVIAERMAKTRSAVLITGESGTGKELFAHAIHNASDRKDFPFIAINCAALPENLLESELFGYVEGAFTGARRGGKLGLFEFAHRGTFFLDEVEGMSPMLQIKLLRVIQEREVMRIGDHRLISVDVRIVAATNESLEKLMQEGKFREDLYYRLNTLPVQLPPLRERVEDISPLLDHFRAEIGGTFRLSDAVVARLLQHPWRGNIRELRNYAEYFTYLRKPVIELDDLPPGLQRSGKMSVPLPSSQSGPRNEVAAGDLTREQRFLLRSLLQDEQEGTGCGRKALVEMARRCGLRMTEYEMRMQLGQLASLGYIKTSRGRGGNRLTDKGREQMV